MRTKSILFLFLTFLSGWYTFGQNANISIRFYNKQIYFPDSPIYIQLEVYNNQSEDLVLQLANNRVFNLNFQVKTMTNRNLPPSREFTTRKNTNQPVFFREITLAPGERYSFESKLDNFIELTDPGAYLVKAHFTPNLSNPQDQMESNWLNLDVRPGKNVPQYQARLDEQTKQILIREALSPDKVVEYTINARQKSQWTKFFLYLDLETLYLRDDIRKERYLRMTESERKDMLDEFRKTLTLETYNFDISTIPWQYEILKTSYTPREGTVETLQKFRYPDYTEIKRFTYYLRNTGDYWQIFDYQVVNVGTE